MFRPLPLPIGYGTCDQDTKSAPFSLCSLAVCRPPLAGGFHSPKFNHFNHFQMHDQWLKSVWDIWDIYIYKTYETVLNDVYTHTHIYIYTYVYIYICKYSILTRTIMYTDNHIQYQGCCSEVVIISLLKHLMQGLRGVQLTWPGTGKTPAHWRQKIRPWDT